MANDEDLDEDTLTIVEGTFSSALGAAVTVSGSTITYDATEAPNLQMLADGASVGDTFTYTVQDPSGAMSMATVTIAVAGVNDDAMATNDGEGGELATDEDTPLMIDVATLLANDADVDVGPKHHAGVGRRA